MEAMDDVLQWFTYSKWWSSIVSWVYQRLYDQLGITAFDEALLMGRVFKRTHEESGFPQIQSLRNPCETHAMNWAIPHWKKHSEISYGYINIPIVALSWYCHYITVKWLFFQSTLDVWHLNWQPWHLQHRWLLTHFKTPSQKKGSSEVSDGNSRTINVQDSSSFYLFKTAAVFTSHKFWNFYTSSKQSLPPFLMFHPKPNPNLWCFSPAFWSPHWMETGNHTCLDWIHVALVLKKLMIGSKMW